jgi:hypothetical protein
MEEPRLNYFNYNTEIEDTFVRRRGKHLFVSAIDWALIETWKQIGIPLHVVLRGIEKAFDSWEAKPRRRSIKTLLYCQEEVEAQYAEWLESRLGAATDDGTTTANEGEDSAQPFSRPAILEHLRQARAKLIETCDQGKANGHHDLCEVLARAANLLADLEAECSTGARPNAQRLEHSLGGIERQLSEALRTAVSQEQLAEITKEIKKQFRPYRSQMEAAVYEQTVDNFLLKRLREQFGVPRLSLFYL